MAQSGKGYKAISTALGGELQCGIVLEVAASKNSSKHSLRKLQKKIPGKHEAASVTWLKHSVQDFTFRKRMGTNGIHESTARQKAWLTKRKIKSHLTLGGNIIPKPFGIVF